MKKILLFIIALMTSFNIMSQATYTANSGIGNFDNPSSWDLNNGTVPGSSDDIVIPANAKIKVNVTGVSVNSFSITGGGILEVNNPITVVGGSNSSISGTGSALDLKDSMTIDGMGGLTVGVGGNISVAAGKQLIFSMMASTLTNNGSITLNSSSSQFSSLVLKGDYDDNSTGQFSYVRFVSGISNDWDLIGSPVVGVTANMITLQSNLATNVVDGTTYYAIGTFDNTTGANGTWSTFDSDDSFTEGTLESAKGFQMASILTGATLNFNGTPLDGNATFAITEGDNNGDVASATGSRWNLVANPYPSYIAANQNASNAGTYSNDYVLNGTNLGLLHANNQALHIWTGTSGGYTEINDATSAADAVIAPGQAFFVGGNHTNSGDLTFNIDMMTENGSDDGIVGDVMNDDRGELFINLVQNEYNRRSQIYFLENTTDNYEPSYDAASMGLNYPAIFTRLIQGDEGHNLGIQSLSYSEMWDKVIPLGINAVGGEEITITISHRTTPADINIYLEDTEEGTMTNLLDGDYVLTPTSDLEGVGRFFIHMTADTMSNGEVSTSMLNAYKEIDASYITVEGLATQSNETNVRLFNILGREVLSTTLNNNMGTQTISTVGLSAGIYVIELESGTDRLTKKLLIQ